MIERFIRIAVYSLFGVGVVALWVFFWTNNRNWLSASVLAILLSMFFVFLLGLVKL